MISDADNMLGHKNYNFARKFKNLAESENQDKSSSPMLGRPKCSTV